MQSKAHQILLLIPLLFAGCSTQVEVSTEKRSPSETTESVEKFSTKVAVDVLSDQEETSVSRPEEPSASRSVEVDGDGNVVVIIETDAPEHPCQKAPAKKSKSGWNTKIPWPTYLRGASSWTVSCYLAVWGLVIAAVVLMIDTAKRKEGGPLLSIVVLLGIAAILLQFQTHTDCGIQFIPISPWCYSGWEAFGVSLFCWLPILAAVFVTVERSPDSPQAFAILCLIALFLNAVLSWSELKADSTSDCQQLEASFLPA